MSRGSCCLLRPMGTLGATQSPLPLSFLVCLMELNHNCLVIREGNSFAFRMVAEQCSCDDARRIDATVDQRSPSKLACPELKVYCFSCPCFFFLFLFSCSGSDATS